MYAQAGSNTQTRAILYNQKQLSLTANTRVELSTDFAIINISASDTFPVLTEAAFEIEKGEVIL